MGTFLEIFFDQFNQISTINGQPNEGYLWMWILLIVAIVGISFALERFIYLWFVAGNANPEKFMDKIYKYTKEKNYSKAHAYAKRNAKSALPYVILSAVEPLNGDESTDMRTIQDSVDTAMMTQMPKLEARISYINMIANIATLIGLAGTIFGLILAFNAVSSGAIPPAEKTQRLAGGISAAMGTTIGGLFVAIPMNIIFTIITNKIKNIINSIDEHSVKLINLIQREK